MFLDRIKSGQRYLVAKRDQNRRHIMSHNFDFINKAICYQRNALRAFEANNSTELFVSNWLPTFFLQKLVLQLKGKKINFQD